MPVFVLQTPVLEAWLEAHYGMKFAAHSELSSHNGRAYHRLTNEKGEVFMLVTQAQPFGRDLIKTWQALYYDYGVRQIQLPPLRAKTGDYDTMLEGMHALLTPDITGKPASTLALDEQQTKQIGMMLAKLHGCKLLNEEKLPEETFENPFSTAWETLEGTLAPDTTPSEETRPNPTIAINEDMLTEKFVTVSTSEETPTAPEIASTDTPTAIADAPITSEGAAPETGNISAPSTTADAPAASESTALESPTPKEATPAHPLHAHQEALKAYYARFVEASKHYASKTELKKRFVACHGHVHGETLISVDEQWHLCPCDTFVLAPAERDFYQLSPLADYLAGYHRLNEGFMLDEVLVAYYQQRAALTALFDLLEQTPHRVDALLAWCDKHLSQSIPTPPTLHTPPPPTAQS